MQLRDYPRPPQDNGLGMHWSGGNPSAVGSAELRDKWIPVLQRMGVKWVKLLHDGGLEFAELLLKAGIMPVVRLYRYQPNSKDMERATLGARELEYLKDYVSLGVRYFEFNNEPELHSEWQGGQVPSDAIDYVARSAILDMETILSQGGYPAVPATAIGTKWDLIGKIIEHGGRALFDEPVWLALHNYDINHPLDYPYDTVNQTGVELSQVEYDAIGTAGWTGKHWGFRARDFVNEQRRQGANPGDTIHDDASSFRSYERLADLCHHHLGRYLPILSTENGPIVGEDDDPRYPTTTTERHAQKAVEQARIMMGVSEQHPPAPPYYFCTAFWLMGNTVLRAGGWEGHAWFSPNWPEGRLPTVDALAALPKVARPLPVSEGEEEPEPGEDPARSAIFGAVPGHAGATVILRSSIFSDAVEAGADGAFRFENLPGGTYRLSVLGTDLVRSGLELDGINHLQVDFEVEGGPEPPEQPAPSWQATLVDSGPSPGFGILRVSVEGMADLPVQISAAGWAGFSQKTGSKSEYGPYALEFSPLGAGRYSVTPAGLDFSTEVELDGSRVLFLTLEKVETSEPEPEVPEPEEPEPEEPEPEEPEPEEPGEPARSVIYGRVENGAGLTIELQGPGGEFRAAVQSDGLYRFSDLPAGPYSLHILGTEIRDSIYVDGVHQVVADYEAPADVATSEIGGVVTNGVGYSIVLSGPEDEERSLKLVEEAYHFSGLPAGTYSLRIPGTDQRRSGLQMDGRNSRTANFTVPPLAPANSAIRGQAPGGAGFEVILQGPEDQEWVQTLGEEEQFAFTGLAAGDYVLFMILPDGEVSESLHVDGSNEIDLTLNLPQVPVEPEEPEEPEPEEPEPTPPTSNEWSYQIEDGGPSPGYAVIRVRIDGQTGRAVRIWTTGWGGMVRYIGEKPEYGEFVCEFSPLGSGSYFIAPEGLGVQAAVQADGARILWVTFFQGEFAPGVGAKRIAHYLLIGQLPGDRATLLAMLRYVALFQPVVGDSLDDALTARRVLILGDESSVSAADAARLANAGARVERFAGADIAARLQQRLESDQPF